MADQTPTTPNPTPPVAQASPAPSGADLLYAAEGTPTLDPAAPEVATTPPAQTPEADGSLIAPPAQAEGEGESQTPAADSPAPESEAPSPETDPAAPLTADSYTITVPEGLVPDPELLTAAKTLFAEVGLDPKGAQPLMDLYARALTAQAEASALAAAQQDAAWRKELYELPAFSGPTRRTSEVTIQRFIDEHGGDELRTVLHNAGLGNNPTVVKALLKAAEALTEGTPVSPGAPVAPNSSGRIPKNLTPGQIVYGDTSPTPQ